MIHTTTDALGYPLRFALTGAQSHDVTLAEILIAQVDKHQAEPIAAPQIDWHTYRVRHLSECFFNRIKHYRRLFSRFDKLASRYLGFMNFVSAQVWLR